MTLMENESEAVARTPRTGLWLVSFQAVLIGVVLALVVLPYFVNGLQNEPVSQVEGGWFDPKGVWPNDTAAIGPVLHTVGYFAYMLGWLYAALVSLMALVLVVLRWRRSVRLERARLLAAVLLGVAYLLFFFGDFGGHLAAWMAD